ncbi:hypothetical protein GCM10009678_70670 [Actinomadura kijaniata]
MAGARARVDGHRRGPPLINAGRGERVPPLGAEGHNVLIGIHETRCSNRTRDTLPDHYYSNMCSTEGEPWAQLAQAIDDLAAEGLADLPPEKLVERIAEIWSLVAALDPDIDRRRQGYATSGE